MRNSSAWDMLEVRHLRAFTEVARLGSFGAAARALGYTQSGVSQQIQGLERIAGTPLLERPPGGRRPVELTDAGRLLLAHAEHLLARVGATRADLAALEAGERGLVAVATIQSVGTRLLPTVLRRFRDRSPGVTVEITEARNTTRLMEILDDGSVDVGLTALPMRPDAFEIHPLGDDPFVLVTAAGRPERRLADLTGGRVLGSRGCVLQDLVEHHLAAAGVDPLGCDLFDDNGMIQELVAAGEGVAVVPRLTVDLDDPRVRVHPVPELRPRTLAAVVHRQRHLGPAARRFLDAAVACAPMLAA
jgi:molybdate transport repressor ModE-like protein